MRRLYAAFSALSAVVLAVILYSGIANAAPSFCTVTGTVYNNATGKPWPNQPVQFWYQPNTQNISGGIISNGATPLQVYTQANGALPSGTGAASLVAGADTYIQVGNDTPQLAYIPPSCGGSSIDLNALMGNPDPPLSPVVTSINLNNTSSLSLSVTNPTGIGPATLNISGLVNSAGNGTITFDNSGNIVAAGLIHAVGGILSAGVTGSQQGCVVLSGATSGTWSLCAPATTGGGIVANLPTGNGAAGYLVSTDGSGNWSYTAPLAVGRGGADKLVVVRDVSTPTTTLDATANGVYMVTPATLVTTYATSFSASDLVVGSQSGSVAGKRDQTSAFGTNTFFHLYAIGGNGQTPALLSSLTAPPTGPTLPTNYTAWAYLGTFITDGSSNVLAMSEYGSLVHYNAPVAILTSGTATSSTSMSLSTSVPTIASEVQLGLNGSAGPATGGDAGNAFIDIQLVSAGSVYYAQAIYVNDVSSNGGGGGGWTLVPNTGSGSLYYKNVNVTGSTLSANINVHGYIVPNNSD